MSGAGYVQDEQELDALLGSQPVLVIDCTASWCGPCKLISPLIDQLATEFDLRAKVLKLDLDQNKGVAKRFGVKSIPAVMFFQNGELMETLVGSKPYEMFKATLEKYVTPASEAV